MIVSLRVYLSVMRVWRFMLSRISRISRKRHRIGSTSIPRFARTLAMPEPIKNWSLTSLKEKLIKIGAKVVGHGRYVAFQMAEVAVPRMLFAEILRLIAELRPPPDSAAA